jgi:hypothetical protein
MLTNNERFLARVPRRATSSAGKPSNNRMSAPLLIASTGFYSDILQFPLYATVIAILNDWRKRLVGSVVLLAIHSVAAVGALTMYRWW